MHVHAGGCEHFPVVDAGPDHHADAGAVQEQPEADTDDHGNAEHGEPVHRIFDEHRRAGRLDDRDHRQDDGAVQPLGGIELVGRARPDGQHQIGGDDRNADGHQGLAQFVSLHPPENRHLQRDPADRYGEEGDGEAEEPAPGRFRHLVADVAAEQIHRAVREIDVAHQAEDQREAARHQEIQAAEGNAVKQGVDECLLAADGADQPVRPDREDHPQQRSSQQNDSENQYSAALHRFPHGRSGPDAVIERKRRRDACKIRGPGGPRNGHIPTLPEASGPTRMRQTTG